MQNPVGMTFNPATARNEMTSFWDVLLSPTVTTKFSHTVTSSFVLASLVVIGISAWYLLQNREKVMAVRSIKIAAIFGGIAAIVMLLTGHSSGQVMAERQPMKLAAAEALYDGQQKAGLSVIGLLKPEDKRTGNKEAFYFNFEIPGMLSWMSFGNTNAFVPGINDLVNGNPAKGIMSAAEKIERGRVALGELAKYHEAVQSNNSILLAEQTAKFDPTTSVGKAFKNDYSQYLGYGFLSSPKDIVPPVPLVFYSFRIMIALGCFFILLFSVVLYKLWRGTIDSKRWMLRVMLWTIPLAYIASACGWIVTEVGRQPWAIQDLMPTVAAVSRIDPASVITAFFIFLALFTILLIAELKILTRQIKNGPGEEKQ
jgi:cytochrome d ubiquinol oxidase subunit I